MGTNRGRATVADVAREAGVSKTTVSYVLNNTPHQKIPDATRQRVHDAVSRLGYTPSAAARALSRGRADTVLLAMPGLPIGPHVAHLIEALAEDLGKQNLTLVTHVELPTRPLAQLWRELEPGAVVTFTPVDPAEQRAMRAAGVFLANLLRSPASTERQAHVLLVPNEEIGEIQVRHLHSTGHHNLGYAMPADARLTPIAEVRLAGVAAACRELGLPEPDVRLVPPDTEGAAEAAATWQAARPRVTAVCAYNDEVAFALLAGMRKLGLTAPDDLAVIGVDNIPTAPFAAPPLTTVDQDIERISAQLAAIIVAGITGKRPPRSTHDGILKLTVRESA
ncbi:LacI family DNA-binding transcriptional regulator [Amycolatopsis australiensis]|uniref:DNA-binding transcriptional regulator, LacI/PurR family n=1 Tax=Amycolatopsis australiensis TaxID=546364 RepID=A0A1K1RTZ0_9PSEU|nr:LacI family DNA-binding transcriptional regulator [Amycolatopsis australiensis]SFW75207.1 DNA-binding transcriptional regulator, LacI/PurR family [Amycolatopsis australiensis]